MFDASSRRKTTKRFTLLLLEEEEDYVADYVGTCSWPSNVPGSWQGSSSPIPGRLRLCTRSLFFDPDDARVPIARLPFVSTQALEATGAASFTLATTSVTKMKANMEEVPYVFEKGQVSRWVFTLSYAPLSSLLQPAQQLLELSRAPKPERTRALEAFVRAREDAVSFDTSRLCDFSERVRLEVPAMQLTPLIRERGQLVVSETRVYFQPLHNISGDTPVRSHPLAAVAAVARRRSSLRPIGLELFFIGPEALTAAGVSLPPGPLWDAPSAFFALRSERDREDLARVLTSSPALGSAVPRALAAAGNPAIPAIIETHGLLLEAQGGWLHRVTAAWQSGRVSNFDYLLYLNLAAGRSFNDLAQWPVFPWVLSSYVTQTLDLVDPANYRDLTRPVGALNQARLSEFRKRYEDMPHDSFEAGGVPPFMYGTHYSTPGYVMYWLLRAAPAHMLRLQNGRFDAPDRLFHAIEESWQSCNHSTTDVKELVPEFFIPSSWDWLVNGQRLPLGVRQSGRAVGDVELPPWAASPAEFLAINRAALEAPPVSSALHHWIDLIFGYKQTGPAAETADNVFYHLTYEGAVDVSKVTDPVELKALETQINEFGQTPKQLFLHPHPPRSTIPPAPHPAQFLPPGTPHSGFACIKGVSQEAGGGSSSVMPSGVPATWQQQLLPGTGSSWEVGSSDAGHKALALALMSTVIAAAAPEYAGAAAEAQRAEAAAATAAEQRKREARSRADAGGATGATSPPSNGAATTPAAAASPAPGQAASQPATLLGSLLKLGRYAGGGGGGGGTTPQKPAAAAAAAPTQAAAGARASHPGPASPTGSHGGPTPAPASSTPATAEHTMATGSTNSGVIDSTAASLVLTPTSTWPHGMADKLRTSLQKACSSAGGSDSASRRDAGSSPSACVVRVSKDALSGVALWRCSPADGYAYCVGAGGVLRVLSLPAAGAGHDQQSSQQQQQQPNVLRSLQLPGDLLCVTPLHGLAVPGSSSSTAPNQQAYATAGGTSGKAAAAALCATRHHPLLLVGAHNRVLHAYCVEQGRVLGSFTPHDDAVCCCAVPSPSFPDATAPSRFLTSSWDCSVKVWSLSEGRHPWAWSSLAPVPEVTLADSESGVWSLAAGQEGSHLVVAGTEEGLVSAWDLRSSAGPTWSASVASDYVGSLALTPCGRFVVAGAADGYVSVLDVRRGGTRLASVPVEAPVRCCLTDGQLAVVGSEAGVLQMLDIGLLTATSRTPCGASPPSLNGLYYPAPVPDVATVAALAVYSAEAGSGRVSDVAMALESGSLVTCGWLTC